MTGGHGDGLGQFRWNRCLPKAIVAPGSNGAVGQERQGVETAGGNILDRRQGDGSAELAQGVGAPSEQFSGGIKGVAVDEASGDRDRVAHLRRVRADLPAPDHQVPGRSWKLPQGTGSQYVDPGALGFTLNRGLQLGFECVAT